MGAGEMELDDEGDAVFGEALLGAPRAVFVNAQLGDFAHEGFRYRARLVAGLEMGSRWPVQGRAQHQALRA